MLKHVHISPMRSRADSISLRSSASSSLTSCASSLCGSPEPLMMTPSRSSSYSSLNESIAQVMYMMNCFLNAEDILNNGRAIMLIFLLKRADR